MPVAGLLSFSPGRVMTFNTVAGHIPSFVPEHIVLAFTWRCAKEAVQLTTAASAQRQEFIKSTITLLW
jgi:hypothetical protein